MFISDFWKTLARAPEAEIGGGDASAAAGQGDAGAGGDAKGAGAAQDAAAAGPGSGANNDTRGDASAAAGGAKWWEDKRFDDPTRTQLKALGLTVDDPLDAVSKLANMEKAAKAKLGRGVDQLMEKPAEGKDVAEWMRENGALFGIPEAPEKYDIKPPESWPKDLPWDKAFEDQARKLAHEAGVSGPALQRMTELYAGKVAAMMGDAESELRASVAPITEELQRDWGDQYPARVAQAQQAASLLAQKAGLDQDAMQSLYTVLKAQTGDANVMRLFAAVGDLAGEDMAVALKGGGGIGTTPAEARQQIEAMKSPDSEYSKEAAKVAKGGNRTRYADLHKQFVHLQKLAAQ